MVETPVFRHIMEPVLFILVILRIVRLAGHHAVSAKGNGPDGKERFLPGFLPQNRAHAQRKLPHIYAEMSGGNVVTKLVNQHNDPQHEYKCHQSHNHVQFPIPLMQLPFSCLCL